MDLGWHQEHYSEVFKDYISILLFLKEVHRLGGGDKGTGIKRKNKAGGRSGLKCFRCLKPKSKANRFFPKSAVSANTINY